MWRGIFVAAVCAAAAAQIENFTEFTLEFKLNDDLDSIVQVKRRDLIV